VSEKINYSSAHNTVLKINSLKYSVVLFLYILLHYGLWQNLLETLLWLTNYLWENKRRQFATDYGWNSKNPQACIWQLDSSIRADDFRW